MPNSRILMPLSGSGSAPLADAKAIAGESRPGSCSAARLFFGSVAVCRLGPRLRRAAQRSAISCSIWPIKSLRLSACRASWTERVALGVERLLGFGLLALALLDEHGHPRSFLRKCGEITAECLPFGGYFGTYSHEFGKVGDQRVDLDLHVGQHRAEQDRGAHRLQRIFRAHQQRGRRVAADPLQRREHLGDHRAAAGERAADRSSRCSRACCSRALGRRDALLDGADVGGRADQQRIELAAVLADRVELGLELGGELGRPLLLGLDLFQFLLPRALGGLGRDRDAGRPGGLGELERLGDGRFASRIRPAPMRPAPGLPAPSQPRIVRGLRKGVMRRISARSSLRKH